MNAATLTHAFQSEGAETAIFRAAFESAPEGLCVIENGRVLLANLAAAKVFGHDDPGALVSHPVDQFFPQGLFCSELSQGKPDLQCAHPACEWIVRRDGGEELRVGVRCTRFRSGDRDLVLTAFREIRRAEIGAMLRSGEPRFRAMFQGAVLGISTCTLDGRVMESNPALSRMLGYTTGELVGMHASAFHPGDFDEDNALFLQIADGTRESFDLEKRFRRKDGTYLWGHVTVSLVRDSGGQPAFAVAMIEDITERKRNEEQLREAEKMEVIGRVAGGIAHDFNNLLTGILLYCDLVLTGPDSERQLKAHVEEIRMAGEQGAALTQQLLAMARKQAPQPVPTQLNQVITSTENLVRRLIGEQHELVTVLDPALDLVMTDPGQMRQVLLNLVLNARDAMPNGGKITVSTQRKTIPGHDETAISLLVSDTGQGMDSETLARLFQPFFTTKKPGEGTGLGLTTVQRIVKEAGGSIEVRSEKGKGTQIEVFFPALKQVLAAPAPVSSKKTGETILLVDDHAAARHSIERVLNQAGYHVLHAASGKRGLSVFAEHEREIDLLLADWMMPGMSGRELAKKLRDRKPGLKVLLISGYQDAPDGRGPHSLHLIRKPFAGTALLGRVREVLDSKGDTTC